MINKTVSKQFRFSKRQHAGMSCLFLDTAELVFQVFKYGELHNLPRFMHLGRCRCNYIAVSHNQYNYLVTE